MVLILLLNAMPFSHEIQMLKQVFARYKLAVKMSTSICVNHVNPLHVTSEVNYNWTNLELKLFVGLYESMQYHDVSFCNAGLINLYLQLVSSSTL